MFYIKNNHFSVEARGYLNSVKPNFCPFFRRIPLRFRYVPCTPYAHKPKPTQLIINESLSSSTET